MGCKFFTTAMSKLLLTSQITLMSNIENKVIFWKQEQVGEN